MFSSNSSKGRIIKIRLILAILVLRWHKDSFGTQDRNEHFKGGINKSTFPRGHSNLSWGSILKKLVSNERHWFSVFTDTLWEVVHSNGHITTTLKNNEFNSKTSKSLKIWLFFKKWINKKYALKTIFSTLLRKIHLFPGGKGYWVQTNFTWPQIS